MKRGVAEKWGRERKMRERGGKRENNGKEKDKTRRREGNT